jgi:hypothetical protein
MTKNYTPDNMNINFAPEYTFPVGGNGMELDGYTIELDVHTGGFRLLAYCPNSADEDRDGRNLDALFNIEARFDARTASEES